MKIPCRSQSLAHNGAVKPFIFNQVCDQKIANFAFCFLVCSTILPAKKLLAAEFLTILYWIIRFCFHFFQTAGASANNYIGENVSTVGGPHSLSKPWISIIGKKKKTRGKNKEHLRRAGLVLGAYRIGLLHYINQVKEINTLNIVKPI